MQNNGHVRCAGDPGETRGRALPLPHDSLGRGLPYMGCRARPPAAPWPDPVQGVCTWGGSGGARSRLSRNSSRMTGPPPRVLMSGNLCPPLKCDTLFFRVRASVVSGPRHGRHSPAGQVSRLGCTVNGVRGGTLALSAFCSRPDCGGLARVSPHTGSCRGSQP